MIIDGHAHTGGEFRDVETIIATLDANRVDRVLLSPGEPGGRARWVPPLGSLFARHDISFGINRLISTATRKLNSPELLEHANESVARMAAEAPDRIMQSLWVDPTQYNVVDLVMDHHREWNFRALKVHQCWHSFRLNGGAMHALADWAGSVGMPLFIHPSKRSDIADFRQLAMDHPGVPLICGHLVGLETMMALGRRPANLFMDISCPPLVSTVRIRKALDWAGIRGLVFGSDTPFGRHNLAVGIGRIESSSLTRPEKDAILGLNMARLLRIPVPASR